MLKAIRKWWEQLGECEEELAKLGVYHYHNAFGQPIYIHREPNDRQKAGKRSTKKSKR
jgi:hypothetical protein